jgi:hypothetical protein
MSDYLKCECPHCGLHIEFAATDGGREINCPQCQQPVQLPVPTAKLIQSEPPPATILHHPQVVHFQPAQISPPLLSDITLLPQITDESLRSIQVRSSDGTRYYTVNLLDYTCTCPAFLEVHSAAPQRDFGRLCKHICFALNQPEILTLLNPICLAMVKEGFGIYPGRLDRDSNGNVIYVTGINGKGWLNVFALKRKDGKAYYRFGYNVNEGRWAFGSRPKINEEILCPERNREPLPLLSRGLGWRIFHGVLSGIGRLLSLLVHAVVYVFVGVLAGLLTSRTKPRRRRRF